MKCDANDVKKAGGQLLPVGTPMTDADLLSSANDGVFGGSASSSSKENYGAASGVVREIRPLSEVGADFRARMVLTREGKPKDTLGNVLILLECAPDLVGCFGFNEMKSDIVVRRSLPWEDESEIGRRRCDEDISRLRAYLQEQHGCIVGKDSADDALIAAAKTRRFNPLTELLDGLVHDGVRRIDSWLIDFCGAADTPLNRAFSRKFLIAAVARALQPGCQVDTVLVLEGPQGGGKSSLVKVLSKGYFTDNVEDVGSGKEAAISLCGSWIVELAELDAIKKSDVARIKAFITRKVDKIRPPYGRSLVDLPRRCVFVATTNETAYLRDETGNRRFWPVRCGAIDLSALSATVDQLWAEAVVAYRAGEPWWLADDALIAAAEQQQGERVETDPWIDLCRAKFDGRDYATTAEVLEVVGVPTALQTRSSQTRAGYVLKEIGFQHRRRLPKSTQRAYFRVEGGQP